MTTDGENNNPEETTDEVKDRASVESFIIEVIQVRLVKWTLLGGFLYVLWGLTNYWPKEIVFAPVLLPLVFLFSQRHYTSHRFAQSVPDELPVWDFLVASLILTVGIASGKLLLVSVGWVTLGISFLKPTKADTNWAEWFKVPFIWIFLLPFWLDFNNNATNLVEYLVYNPLSSGNSEKVATIDYVRFHFGVIASLIIMALGLKGGHFWRLLLVLPIVAVLYSGLNKFLPHLDLKFGFVQSLLAWTLLPGTIFVFVLAFNKIKKLLRPEPGDNATDFLKKHKTSSFFLWLSFLVIASQQFNLIRDNYFIENTQRMSHLALAIWLLGLFWLRYQTQATHVDTRTKIIIAISLAILVTAEWTDINFMRHISLGMGLIAITSWRRVWPTSLLCLLLGMWVLIIPAGQTATTVALMKGFGEVIILSLAILAYIIALSLFQIRKKQDIKLLNSGDYEWLPSMRFSFLIMILLLSFQFLSAIDDQSKAPPPILPEIDSYSSFTKLNSNGLSTNEFSGLSLAQIYESRDQGNAKLTLLSALPVREPYKVPSALLTLKELGWKASNRKLINSHPMGSAMAVDLTQTTSDSSVKLAKALFWWSNGQKTFYSHKRAQNMLWSSWYHAQRDLQLHVLIQHSQLTNSIEKIAIDHNWFLSNTNQNINN